MPFVDLFYLLPAHFSLPLYCNSLMQRGQPEGWEGGWRPTCSWLLTWCSWPAARWSSHKSSLGQPLATLGNPWRQVLNWTCLKRPGLTPATHLSPSQPSLRDRVFKIYPNTVSIFQFSMQYPKIQTFKSYIYRIFEIKTVNRRQTKNSTFKGLFIYYVIQFGGLGRPLPPMKYCNKLAWPNPPPNYVIL